MRGLSAGLPLVVNMRLDAGDERAFAPRPYTVSVGNATTRLACKSLTAASRAFRVLIHDIVGGPAVSGKDMEVGSHTRTLVENDCMRQETELVVKNIATALDHASPLACIPEATPFLLSLLLLLPALHLLGL